MLASQLIPGSSERFGGDRGLERLSGGARPCRRARRHADERAPYSNRRIHYAGRHRSCEIRCRNPVFAIAHSPLSMAQSAHASTSHHELRFPRGAVWVV
jgi:hypothetical protein